MKVTSPKVKAICVLDSEGTRVCAKYYDKSYPTLKDQLALEKKLHSKTKNSNARAEADIILIENIVSVYRSGSDVTIHTIGASSENEILLLQVLDATYNAINTLLKPRMDRHMMLENIEHVLLTLDEVVDGGVILELDASLIAKRVLMRGSEQDVPTSELTISQALATAREQFARSFRGN
uniref:Coatomer subunit zeta n=1 Tax=Albugo laibachii Nc14 TaxID=890382 RepID=F0WT73_9STRA|nr:coatomer subunit zeta1 putative [Albugo laibachii Nc14]|eukprot:CCA24561.1 coatomer subunit zeta1 putative [Albugo laibachii Nc14]